MRDVNIWSVNGAACNIDIKKQIAFYCGPSAFLRCARLERYHTGCVRLSYLPCYKLYCDTYHSHAKPYYEPKE